MLNLLELDLLLQWYLHPMSLCFMGLAGIILQLKLKNVKVKKLHLLPTYISSLQLKLKNAKVKKLHLLPTYISLII